MQGAPAAFPALNVAQILYLFNLTERNYVVQLVSIKRLESQDITRDYELLILK